MKKETRGFLYLLNEEFLRIFKFLIIICIFSMVGQLLLIGWAAQDYGALMDRFESFYSRSGSIIMFIVSLACIVGVFVLHFYSHYWGSKSIYTLMTLPMERSRIYTCFLVIYLIGLMLFLILSIATVIMGYGLFYIKQMNIQGGKYVMHNGLFLAFVRSDFLRLLVPLTWKSFYSSLSLWGLLPITIIYGVICERSLRYWNLVLVSLSLVLMIITVSQRMGYNNDYLLVISIAMSLLGCFFVWHSIKIINRNGITG